MSYMRDAAGRRLDTFPVAEDALRHQGLKLIAESRCNPSASSPYINQNNGTRVNIIPVYSASHVVLAFTNISGANALGEWGGDSTVWVAAALEYLTASGVTSETGQRVPARFNGQLRGELPPGGILYSDPIKFDVVAGTQFFIRTTMQTTGSNLGLPTGFQPQGTTGPGGLNNGDSGSAYSATRYGSMGTGLLGLQSLPAAVAVLGYTSGNTPSAAVLGDSIQAGTGDAGYGRNDGGYLVRALNKQLSRSYVYPTTPAIPHIRLARGGEQLHQWLNQASSTNAGNPTFSEVRSRLANLASTILFAYGTNDMSTYTLAQMQADYLQAANAFLQQGKRFVACTLLPKTTSTDGFTTVANQTVLATESIRTGFNTWLRNGTFAAATVKAANVRVFDGAAAVEVNSAGVATLNGGFWKPAPGAALPSGTVTSGSSITLLNDTTKAWTQDQWRGYAVQFTSGALSGTIVPILSNTPTALNLAGTGTNPATGDGYKITDSYTVDGTHPTSGGHALIAASFDLGLVG